jgi:hypothetical protein
MVLSICSPSKKFPVDNQSLHILREPPVTAETPVANQKKYVLPPAATRVPARYRTRGSQPIIASKRQALARANAPWSPTGINVPCPKAQAIQNIDHETTAFNN